MRRGYNPEIDIFRKAVQQAMRLGERRAARENNFEALLPYSGDDADNLRDKPVLLDEGGIHAQLPCSGLKYLFIRDDVHS